MLTELCPCCAGPTWRAYCAGCTAEWRRIDDPCAVCGLPSPVAVCPRREPGWRLATLRAPFVYCAPLKDQIHALKFHGARELGRAMGLELAERLVGKMRKIDALVAVPLHPRRLRERGYNQALEIALALAPELGLGLLWRGVARRRGTAPQAGLKAAARARNLAGAFRVSLALEGRHIAIVDDVVTTGATVNALAGELLAAGAASVTALAVARTLDSLSREK